MIPADIYHPRQEQQKLTIVTVKSKYSVSSTSSLIIVVNIINGMNRWWLGSLDGYKNTRGDYVCDRKAGMWATCVSGGLQPLPLSAPGSPLPLYCVCFCPFVVCAIWRLCLCVNARLEINSNQIEKYHVYTWGLPCFLFPAFVHIFRN